VALKVVVVDQNLEQIRFVVQMQMIVVEKNVVQAKKLVVQIKHMEMFVVLQPIHTVVQLNQHSVCHRVAVLIGWFVAPLVADMVVVILAKRNVMLIKFKPRQRKLMD